MFSLEFHINEGVILNPYNFNMITLISIWIIFLFENYFDCMAQSVISRRIEDVCGAIASRELDFLFL